MNSPGSFFFRPFAPPVLCFVLVSVLLVCSYGALSDTLKSKPSFWTDYKPIGAIQFYGHPTPEFSDYTKYHYSLYRDVNGAWYMIGNGNGQVWLRDSTGNWNRLDRTFFSGYNFDAFLHGFMKFGGYGYWKTNGFLLYYVPKTGEWEAAQLNREIPGYGAYTYYHRQKGNLYLLGSVKMNTGLTKEYQYSDSVYSLEVLNKTWTSIGKMTTEADSLLSPRHWHRSYVWPRGLFMYAEIINKSIFVDFHSMRCILPDDSAQTAYFKFYASSKESQFFMSTDYGLYKVDTVGYQILDSLSWNDLLASPKMQFDLLQQADNSDNSLTGFGIAGMMVVLVGAAGGWYWSRKKRLKTMASAPSTLPVDKPIHPLDQPCNNTLQLIHGDPAFNNRLLNERLTKQGLLIINVLYEKHLGGDVLDTLQLNDLLQIAERSLDNQKKIRSELVKQINTVFRDLGFNEDAVLRIRQTDDRRMLVYALNPRIIVEK